ncbi:MAG: hypothetical protein R8F63_20395 [Acidimicrobiales bacterium]|nr:hypothetical protein [Acidimicrobiales bacterium]GJM36698.1 MAG: hypothetical protein DHS20C19_00650 [Acidimicrobiales bacterium]
MTVALRRCLGALALVIGVGLGGALPAAAHGDPEFSGDVGPFAVEAFDEEIAGTDLLYTVVVNDPSTGLPVRGARVEVNAVSETRQVGPLVGNELGGAYQVLLPELGEEAWLITVRIVVAGDAVTFEHELNSGAQSEPRWRTAVVAAGMVIAGVAVLTFARVVRRKSGIVGPRSS